MSKTAMLHEILAAEKTRVDAATKSIEESKKKFAAHTQFFGGKLRTLTMLADSPTKDAMESAAKELKIPTTTVVETLAYTLGLWATAENVRAAKNNTNTYAKASIVLANGNVLADGVPVDELMGLETRISKELIPLIAAAPTLDPATVWKPAPAGNYYESDVRITAKTEKVEEVLTLAVATEHHPAQVKTFNRDTAVGKFYDTLYSGLFTTHQKAAALAFLDDLLVAVKAARNRANAQEVKEQNIGTILVGALLEIMGPAVVKA